MRHQVTFTHTHIPTNCYAWTTKVVSSKFDVVVKYRSNDLFLVWKATELQQALNPIINKLWAQDPEALPFRSPVDPVALGIPVSNAIPLLLLLKY